MDDMEPDKKLFEEFSWLDLDRYEVMQDATLDQWVHAFELRRTLKAFLYEGRNDPKWFEQFDGTFQEAIRCEKKVYPVYGPPIEYGPEHELHYGLSSVTPVSVVGLSGYWSGFISDPRGKAVDECLLEGFRPADPELQAIYDHIERMPLVFFDGSKGDEFLEYYGGLTIFQVDLGAPDKVLQNDFAELVQKLKQELEISSPKKFGMRDLAKWHRNRILPYLDIMLYVDRHDITITQQQIGLLLWPNDYEISLDDKIRHTVKPLADRLLKEPAIAALRAQADSEFTRD